MKAKIINYTELIIILLLIIFGLAFSIANSFNLTSFYVVIGLFSGACFVELILIIIKLSVLDGYDFKRYTPYLHASYLIGSILMYYLCKNLKHFDEYSYLYWGGLLIINFGLILLFFILNRHAKPDKPKIIPNRH